MNAVVRYYNKCSAKKVDTLWFSCYVEVMPCTIFYNRFLDSSYSSSLCFVIDL